jgi:predicted membrane-bound spermidine synthase
MTAFLYVVFVLSGAAGLIYESIWSRYLGLFVGHSAYAQIIVLVIFLGGMALGALAVGRHIERLAEPLKWYALVEIAVGVIGLLFHDLFAWVTGIAYDTIFPALPAPVLVTMVKWLLAALLILPQSILLGATFPLMSAGVLRLLGRTPGRVLALLYFANSLGAAIGVLLAGFYLIALAGLPGTLLAAVIINLLVGLGVLAANRFWGLSETRPETGGSRTAAATAREASPAAGAARDPLLALLLVVSFGTAVASFIYEIAWIRMLSLVLGSATHSFELMLSAFILGLALGAFWIRARADRLNDPLRTLGIVQWLMGTLAIATLPLYVASFSWTVEVYRTVAMSEHGYAAFSVARYAICLAVMLPATFCAGITLPLITRTLLQSATGERAVGLVYGVNTLGSIVGVALAGLVLMPLIGVKALLVVGALGDMALGVLLLARGGGARWMAGTRLAPIAAAASVLVVIGTLWGTRFDKRVLAGGVYRVRALPRAGIDSVVSYRDGRTASVAVLRTVATGAISIITNGKPDGSIEGDWVLPERRQPRRRIVGGDETTQILAGILPIAYRPGASRVAVIGQGTGMTSHMMLASPRIEELITIDIEPEMIDGSRYFYPANRRVFDDPRSHFVIDDAKAYFSAGRRRFDIILSEPSNPWVSGVSGLFTTEFYERVKTYLADGGILGQWLHLYEISDELVLSVIAAIHANFPSYEIYQVSDLDLMIIAGTGPTLPRPDWSVLDLPALTADLAHLRPINRETVEGSFMVSRSGLAPLIDRRVAPNSDFYPVLDLGTERTRFLARHADGFARLHADRFDVVGAMAGRRAPFGDDLVGAVGGIPRLRGLGLGARMRAHRAGIGLDSLPRNAMYEMAVFRARGLESFYASRLAPGNWELFIKTALEAERDLHLGTAGVADERFYRPLFEYLRVVKAPAEAVAAINYAHALAIWDFERARQAGDTLVTALQGGREWMSVDFLRDGLVVANLRVGDPAGARRILDGLRARSTRPPTSLRSLLLEAYVVTAEDAAATAMQEAPVNPRALGEPRPRVGPVAAERVSEGVQRQDSASPAAGGRIR